MSLLEPSTLPQQYCDMVKAQDIDLKRAFVDMIWVRTQEMNA